MKIEFYYKASGDIITDPSDFAIDYEGDVFEIHYEYDGSTIDYNLNIGWRVIDG